MNEAICSRTKCSCKDRTNQVHGIYLEEDDDDNFDIFDGERNPQDEFDVTKDDVPPDDVLEYANIAVIDSSGNLSVSGGEPSALVEELNDSDEKSSILDGEVPDDNTYFTIWPTWYTENPLGIQGR